MFIKSRRFWAVTALVVFLLSALTVGRWAMAEESADTDSAGAYEGLKVFTEVLSVVKRNYVEDVKTKDLIYDALNGMLRSLDPHSAFMTPDMYKEMQVDTRGEFGGLGIQISIKDDVLTVIAPIEDTPAWRAGIQAGDKILKIAGEPTTDMALEEAVKRMRGPKGTPVTITIIREGMKAPKDYTIVRDIIKVQSVKSRMLDDVVGYIKLNQFQERSASDMADALKKLKSAGAQGLILDLRNNPGGLLDVAVNISGLFLPDDSLVVYTKTRAGEKKEYRSSGQVFSETMPIVVLVNQGSASASEIVAGALKDYNRGVILGVKTFGKGSVQSVIPLSDGAGLRLTTAKYYTPKGTSIQNTGIAPNIVVKLEPKNGMKEHAILREKDLKGRLDNEQTDADKAAPETEQKPAKQPEDEDATIVNLSALKDEDDNQLQRAADILRSWLIFKELPAGKDNASATHP